MFKNTVAPNSDRANGTKKAVVNSERDAWLQMDRAIAGESGGFFRLYWAGRLIPFWAPLRTEIDENTKQEFYVYELPSIGDSPSTKLPPYRFVDDAEQIKGLLLAAEALITFGGLYDGDKFPDGTFRVETNGIVYTRRDF